MEKLKLKPDAAAVSKIFLSSLAESRVGDVCCLLFVGRRWRCR